LDRYLTVVAAEMEDNSFIEGYSLNKLQRLAEGDANLIIEMLQIYLQNADKDISGLRTSCLNNNRKLTGALAHKLIPACDYLQLDRLVVALKAIEITAKKVQDHQALIQLVEQATNAYSQVRPLIVSDLQKLKRDKIFLPNY
jgi:HPt (histidine-containing phosphotransfer) domain-containing protein